MSGRPSARRPNPCALVNSTQLVHRSCCRSPAAGHTRPTRGRRWNCDAHALEGAVAVRFRRPAPVPGEPVEPRARDKLHAEARHHRYGVSAGPVTAADEHLAGPANVLRHRERAADTGKSRFHGDGGGVLVDPFQLHVGDSRSRRPPSSTRRCRARDPLARRSDRLPGADVVVGRRAPEVGERPRSRSSTPR